jgi:HEAT repeat protein
MRLITAAVLVISLAGCTTTPAPDSGARVRHWIETLRQPDAKQRKQAAFKLGNLGLTDPATVVPALIGALRDEDAGVRSEAILALLKCGPTAKDALPQLSEVQRKDGDVQVRSYAAKALAKIEGF